MGICGRRCRRDGEVIQPYFADKVVWITGASSGLGEALCLALCKLAKPRAIVLSARREAELERVRFRCLELRPGMQVAVLPVDLAAGSEHVQEVAEKAVSLFGGIDVLVNNAGVGFRGLGCETSLPTDRLVMEIDYFSGVTLVKALLPRWLNVQRGHVVQISSVQGFFGLPGRTAYAAAKHAAIGFYDSLRAEVSDSGITVTTVAPGYIRTSHSQNAVKDAACKYPEGHTSKGVPPEVLAPQILAAVARQCPEFVAGAGLDARLAIILRVLSPHLLFKLMRRRAEKERDERDKFLESEAGAAPKDKAA